MIFTQNQLPYFPPYTYNFSLLDLLGLNVLFIY